MLTAREGRLSAESHSWEKGRPKDCLFFAFRRPAPRYAREPLLRDWRRSKPPEVAPFKTAANILRHTTS